MWGAGVLGVPLPGVCGDDRGKDLGMPEPSLGHSVNTALKGVWTRALKVNIGS